MALITKDERQTVFDVLLENAGAISGLFDFLKANNLQELDVPAGEYLAPIILKSEVVSFFKQLHLKNGYQITTGYTVSLPVPSGSFSLSFSNSFN